MGRSGEEETCERREDAGEKKQRRGNCSKFSSQRHKQRERETSCARTLQLRGPPQRCLYFPYSLPLSYHSRWPGCLSVKKTHMYITGRNVVAEPNQTIFSAAHTRELLCAYLESEEVQHLTDVYIHIIYQNIQEYTGIYTRIYRNIQEYTGIYWNIYQNILEYTGIYQNILEYTRSILSDIERCARIYWELLCPYLESEEVQHLTDVKVMTEQHVTGNLRRWGKAVRGAQGREQGRGREEKGRRGGKEVGRYVCLKGVLGEFPTHHHDIIFNGLATDSQVQVSSSSQAEGVGRAEYIHSKNRIVILTINLSCLLQMSEPI